MLEFWKKKSRNPILQFCD